MIRFREIRIEKNNSVCNLLYKIQYSLKMWNFIQVPRNFCFTARFWRCFQWEDSSLENRGRWHRKWCGIYLPFCHMDCFSSQLRVKTYQNYSKVLPCKIWGTSIPTTVLRIQNVTELSSGHFSLSLRGTSVGTRRKGSLKTSRAKARIIDDKGGGWDFSKWPFGHKIQKGGL